MVRIFLTIVAILLAMQVIVRPGASVSITAPTSGATFDAGTNETLTTLAGSATTGQGSLTVCTWTNSLGGGGTAVGTTSWSVPSIALSVGSNIITVTCTDTAMTSGQDVLTVTHSDEVSPTPCTDAHNGSTARYLWTGATGANNGTSWTNAWTDQNTAAANATRGQTVCVADGSGSGSPFTLFTTAESGGTPITFVKATIADHGTATGWSDPMGDGQYSWGDVCIENDYYVIDGQTRNESDWGVSSAYGFRFSGIGANNSFCSGAGGNIILRYVDIGQGDGMTYGSECCVAVDIIGGNGNWVISRSKIHNASYGITTTNTPNLILEYSYGGPTWGKEFWRGFTGTTGGIARFNILHDTCMKEPGAPPEGNSGCTAPIAFFTTSDTNGNNYANAQIYGNVIGYSTGAEANDTNNSNGVVYLPATSGSVVYNNTFYRFHSNAVIDFSGFASCTGCIARNNLHYAHSGGASTAVLGGTASNNDTETEIFVDDTSTGPGDRPNFRLTEATTTSWFALSSPYNVDLDDVTRATDGTGDIGAFEFDDGGGELLAAWQWLVAQVAR